MARVKDIMKRDVITISADKTVSDAAKVMTNNKIGSVVVVKGQDPIGIVTNDDIVTVVSKGLDPKGIKIRDLKKRELIYVSPEESLLAITKKMIKTGVKRLPVLDNGKLVGIVSEKEVLLVSPELIDILSEKLKARVSAVANLSKAISGICENCEGYSDDLRNMEGRWVCEGCRD